jgi:mono/diheme cytochrome c family protein
LWRWTIKSRINPLHTKFALAAAATLAVLALAGCRQDMHDQPKFIPQRGTEFYADGRSARPQVENTVARGQLHQDAYFSTGKQGGKEGDAMPFPVTMAVLERGQERFNIYCTPCHSRVGNGAGMIVQRGYRPAGNFHTPRLMAAPLGHFFNVMTNGYGAMPDYASQVTPQDRWAIVAYIRALQLSQNAKPGDVAEGAQVESLPNIAEREGLPANFAADWALPPTAVYGTPNNQDNGIPELSTPGGKNPGAQPAAPALSRPNTPAPANKQ